MQQLPTDHHPEEGSESWMGWKMLNKAQEEHWVYAMQLLA